MFKLYIFDETNQFLKESTWIVNRTFFNVNNVFQPKNNTFIRNLSVADKQGIRLKMHKMAILETLIFKNFWGVYPHTP